MKKIIALILATIMVMLAVAACGGNKNDGTTAPTAGTTAATTTEGNKATTGAQATTGTQATTQATTQGTTTTEQVVIPDPVDVVVYYTMGEDPIAINVATNQSAGQLKLAEGSELELVQGNFYVATYYNGESTAKANLGAALKTEKTCLGLNIVRSEASPLYNPDKPGAKPGGNWLKDLSSKNYTTNMYMDVAALNEAMGTYSSLGHFGTFTVKDIVGGEIYLESNNTTVGEVAVLDIKVQFAYITYDGKVIKTATNKEAKTPISNAVDLLRYANDLANDKEVGWTVATWQGFVDNYGLTTAKYMCTCEVCDGKINLQTHWLNLTNPSHVAVNYASAIANIGDLDPTKADEYKAIFEAADAAQTAAQKAFDDAVAANADVAALKAAAEASGATEEAKKAYTDAIAADANLKALNDALTAAKEARTTANSNNNKVINYNTWVPVFPKFLAAYEEAANLVLWDAEDMENSYLYKALVDADKATYPSFTYYYDAATDTYTIYVTSMFNSGVSTRLS